MAAVALMMIIIQILCVYIPTTALIMISADFNEGKSKDEIKQISTLSDQFVGRRAKTGAAVIDKLVEVSEGYLVTLEELESVMKKIDGS